MKRWIISVVTGLFVAVIAISCSELLIEEPKDRIVFTNFFENTGSLDAAITASYGQLISNTWNKSLGSARVHALFAGADDWTSQTGGNKRDWKQGDVLAVSSADVGISDNGWGLPYDVILQANFAMQGKETLEQQGEDPDILNAMIGEAHFLRAWGYFWLVRLYGGVPLVLTPEPSEENLNLARSSVEDVYDQILEDLELATLYLPGSQPELGRVTKWAAKALRSKVYLTMAGWPMKRTEFYQNAMDDAEDIIKNSPYSLEPVFSDIFDINNEDSNSEYIWQLRFCDVNTCDGGFNTPFASQSTKPSELGGFQDLFIEKAFYNRFPEGDRKEYTFLSRLISETGDTIVWQDFSWQHPFLSKFYSGTVNKDAPFESQVGTTATASGNDFPMYRISEIYMIYAESQLMSGLGDPSLALEYVNKIRRRAKGVEMESPNPDDLTALDLDVIIEERGWEFVGEMKRWFDLIRTERLAEALSFRDPSEMELIGDPENKNLYYHPLPDIDLSLNPNLEQNPR
jgi:hypothetical protein